MTTINPDFFISQFREEANDHIQGITQRLFQLEEQSGDQDQLIEEMLRIAHTLKGSARMMGYADISTLAHKMEDLFVELRNGYLELHPTITDVLFYCLDTINYLIEGLYKNIKRTANIEEISALFNDLIAGKTVDISHLQSQIVRPLQAEKTDIGMPVKREVSGEQLKEAEERHYVRIHTGDLDTILNLVGEVVINQYRYDKQIVAFQELIQYLRSHRYAVVALQELLKHENNHGAHPRIAAISEQLEQTSDSMVRKAKALIKQARMDGQHMRLTMDKLQEQVIDIRMVPASRIFNLFQRVVRMTARKLGKDVQLSILGEDTKIDSRIIEEMRDPLIHLVQNAVRHGIETPEERQINGKDPTGTITVAARQEGNRIVIQVQDDGRGLDVPRIKDIALKNGLLSRRNIRTVSDQEVFEILFHPGFTTTEAVDDIAGRGFGLNIVRTHVDRVQGEIEVRSQSGKGTEFTLKLPLTLTIINALLVQVQREIFAIPTAAVEKTFDVEPAQIEQIGTMSVITTDDAVLPVVELHEILGFPKTRRVSGEDNMPSAPAPQNPAQRTAIVIQSEDRRIGFLVDDLVEEREIVVKHLGSCLKRVKNVAGATTVLGDVIMILYVRDLVRSANAFLEQTLLPQEEGAV